MSNDMDVEAKALALFEQALDQPSDQRLAWIKSQTQNSIILRDKIVELMSADQEDANLIHTGEALSDHYHGGAAPEKIGAYKITDLIGQGGMGAVYKGERDAGDFEHVVAVKVIKPGLLSDKLKPRFQNEQQILASFSHPNIARLYDGGETDDGAPFIIMEYIEGAPVTDWANNEALNLTARLKLFQTACEAVSYAHQNLIIHRDLTPSNVLVTEGGQLKLIDFGIAKPHIENAPDERPISSIASLSFTPGFAAPERSKGAAANTLSDIFSLGKLLEILVSEKNIPADIMAIIQKATATEPDNRYTSVDALSDDITNYLDGFPVNAMQGGSAYRFSKFVNRNRLAVGASSLGLLIIVGALGITTHLFQEAEQARAAADKRYNEVHAIANTMMFDVYDEVSKIPGSTKARALLASTAQEYLDSLATDEVAGTVGFDIKLSAGLGYSRLAKTMGTNEQSLGFFSNSKTNYEKSILILKELATDFPDQTDVQIYYGQTLTAYADALFNIDDDFRKARDVAWDAIHLMSNLPEVSASSQQISGLAYLIIGNCYHQEKAYKAAHEYFNEGIEILSTDTPSIQQAIASKRALGDLWSALGYSYYREALLENEEALLYSQPTFEDNNRKLEQSIEALEKAVAIKRDIAIETQNEPKDVRGLIITMLNLMKAKGVSGDLETSFQIVEEAHSLVEQAYLKDSADVSTAELLVSVKVQYGGMFGFFDKPSQSENIMDQAVVMAREVSEKNNDVARGKMFLASRLNEAALGYARIGLEIKRCNVLKEAIEVLRDYQTSIQLSELYLAGVFEPMLKLYENC